MSEATGNHGGGRVLSIGECMIELSVERSGLYRKGFAGDTFNTAWYLRRLLPESWSVGYLSTLGDDGESDALSGFIAEAGIETQWIARIPGRSPGLYMIRLDGAERSFTYWRDRSAAKELAADHGRLERAFDAAEVLYFSGITLAILSERDRERLLHFLAAAKAGGKVVAFDPNIRPRLWPDEGAMRDAIEAGARASTICLPSLDDEMKAFGDLSADATADRYLRLGATEVVVKNGGEPALLVAGKERLLVEARAEAEPVDTTGAGDSFSAAYLAARLCGRELAEAVRSAHGLAGEVVRHRGALIHDRSVLATLC